MLLQILLFYYFALEKKFPNAPTHVPQNKAHEPQKNNPKSYKPKDKSSSNASTLPCMQQSTQPCDSCLQNMFPEAAPADLAALGEEIKKIPVEQRPYFLGQVSVESNDLKKSVESTDTIYEKDGKYYDLVSQTNKKKKNKGILRLRRREIGKLSDNQKENIKNEVKKNRETIMQLNAKANSTGSLSKKEEAHLEKAMAEYNAGLKELRADGAMQPVFGVKTANAFPVIRDTLVVKKNGAYSFQPNENGEFAGYETEIIGWEHDLSYENKLKKAEGEEYKKEDFIEVSKEDGHLRKVEKNYLSQREDFVAQSKEGKPTVGQGFIQVTGETMQNKFIEDYNNNLGEYDQKINSISEIGENPKLKAASARWFWNEKMKNVKMDTKKGVDVLSNKFTRIVNGGSNEAKKRKKRTKEAMAILNRCTCSKLHPLP